MESRRAAVAISVSTGSGFDRRASLLMHTVNAIGEGCPLPAARAIGDNLRAQGALSAEAARLMQAALSGLFLWGGGAGGETDALRASLMKQMLTAQIV